jgi:putative MATE family efflux protein
LWVTVFSGSSIASQRLGAGNGEKAVATIATYSVWIIGASAILALAMYHFAPYVTALMGLPTQVQSDANVYMSIICVSMIVLAVKMIFQSILNMYGEPQWNMYANIVFFSANVFGNALVVYGWFGFPEMGIVGVAWASVIASVLGVLVSGTAVLMRIKLKLRWQNFRNEFANASRHTLRIALPSMIEPLSFDLNMIVLNSFAASLGAVALAAKIYTFNTFLIGIVITLALTMATEVLVCQRVGAGDYQKAAQQMRQSIKAALWGSGIVVVVLFLFHHPIMDSYSDDEVLIGMSFWMFLLAALSEPPRAINIMTGGVLRATGDGLLISILGPLFTWTVAIPAAYVMAFVLGWGVYGIMLSAILDEGCRAIIYWKRWHLQRWHHTHVHALEQRNIPIPD